MPQLKSMPIRNIDGSVHERHLGSDIDAETFAIVDAAEYFTGTTIEEALAEICGNLDDIGLWDISTLNHNSLDGLDGGTTDEYYHLTQSDYNALTDENAQLSSLQTDGSPIFTNLTLGAASDAILTFDGALNNGIITWIGDSDYFKFSDNVMFETSPAIKGIFFRDAEVSIRSLTDGHLDIDADISIDLNSAVTTSSYISAAGSLYLGSVGSDYFINFNGTNEGVLTWMEDEDYFKFSDDVLLSSTEKIYFRDTAIHIASADDGHLDITADTSIDMNGSTQFSASNVYFAGGTTYKIESDGDAVFKDLTASKLISAELEFTGDITLDAINAAANSTVYILNSDGTYKANLDIENDLTVHGNFTVNGTTTTVNTETVQVEDNRIVINYGEVGAGVTAGVAGLEVERGSETNYVFQFDETADNFQIGMIGSLQPVCTRTDSASLTDDGIMFWDAANYRIENASTVTFNGTSLVIPSLVINASTAVSDIINSEDAFSDSDAMLMTAKAIADKIEAYGYSTTVGTVTSVTGTLPISSSGGATPAISISQSSAGGNGYLSSTDWSTFNGKQAALTGSISGTANQVTVSANSNSVATNTTISIPSSAQLSVAKLTNLTSNGFVKTGSSDGTLSVDTTSYQAALTFGIANTNAVKIDHASVADNDFAKFTANGLEGRSYSETLSDIGAAASSHTHDDRYYTETEINATKVAFRAYMSADQGVTNSTTEVIEFNNETFDPNNVFNTATYTFTAPATGYYAFHVKVAWKSGSTYTAGKYTRILFRESAGSTNLNIDWHYHTATVTTQHTQMCFCTAYLTSGTGVTVEAYHNEDALRTLYGTYDNSYFEGWRIK